jgi:hypothetical protein
LGAAWCEEKADIFSQRVGDAQRAGGAQEYVEVLTASSTGPKAAADKAR